MPPRSYAPSLSRRSSDQWSAPSSRETSPRSFSHRPLPPVGSSHFLPLDIIGETSPYQPSYQPFSSRPSSSHRRTGSSSGYSSAYEQATPPHLVSDEREFALPKPPALYDRFGQASDFELCASVG